MHVTTLPLAVTAYTATSALGLGLGAHLDALDQQRSGLRPGDFGNGSLACWIGRVPGLETNALPADFAQWDCRNNRLAWLGMRQDDFMMQVGAARERYGAARIALLLGTSTASIGATEEGYRRLEDDHRLPADLHRTAIHHAQLADGVRGRRVGHRRPKPDHLYGLLIERQSIRECAEAYSAGCRRCSRRGRCRFVVR